MTLEAAGRVHFIGVGGAGMSAIAKVLLERGHEVSGSDLKRSRGTTMLEAMGASIHIGHDPALVEGADVCVVSSAIHASNPELARAQELGIEVLTRGGALAALLNDGAAIVVAGTHGKTTTTSMIVTALRVAGDDPTYLVGGGLNDSGTNARSGRGRLSVAESDESDGSFLLLEPHIAVVTNVEADHLDHWGSLEAIREGFEKFLDGVKPGGALVLPAADAHLSTTERAARRLTFGDGGDVRAEDVNDSSPGVAFTLVHESGRARVQLRVPGRHNVSNALAAAGACLLAGLPLQVVARGLGEYRGVERRFQVRGSAAGVTVIDDYAHHPTEVNVTLEAARVGPWRRVVAVFQPHRYSRTSVMYTEFGRAFAHADRVVVTDIYGAGEQAVPGVTGKLVADAVCARLPGRPVAYLPHRDELLAYLTRTARPGDAILTLGAGDITALGDELLATLGSSGTPGENR